VPFLQETDSSAEKENIQAIVAQVAFQNKTLRTK